MFHLALLVPTLIISCSGHDVPDFNFTLSSRHNKTGYWYANVHLGHEGGRPWDVYLDHTTVNWNGTDSIMIDAKIIVPTFDDTKEMKLNYTNHLLKLGYKSVDGLGCYKFHNDSRDWTSAERICEEEGSHLWVVDSEYEAHKVAELLFGHQVSYSYIWVGFHYVQGRWMTVLNKPVTYTGSDPASLKLPKDNRKCAYFNYYGGFSFYLRDYYCISTNRFICEKELQ